METGNRFRYPPQDYLETGIRFLVTPKRISVFTEKNFRFGVSGKRNFISTGNEIPFLGIVEWRNGRMAAEWRNGRLAEWSNGERWQNGGQNGGMAAEVMATRMAGMSTYLLFYGTRRRRRHRQRHLLIFYSIDITVLRSSLKCGRPWTPMAVKLLKTV